MKEKVQAAINAMKNPAKAFYSTDFGRALLCDYENQYGLNVDGAFIEKYINGSYNGKFKTDYDSKKPITVSTKIYSQKDHEKYLRSTKQWAEDRIMVDNRLVETLNLLLDKYGYIMKDLGIYLKLSLKRHYSALLVIMLLRPA